MLKPYMNTKVVEAAKMLNISDDIIRGWSNGEVTTDKFSGDGSLTDEKNIWQV